MLRKLVGVGLQEYRAKKALELYRCGKISLWKAARMAGMTYRGALIWWEIRLRMESNIVDTSFVDS